jgi:hypothetical protein
MLRPPVGAIIVGVIGALLTARLVAHRFERPQCSAAAAIAEYSL